MFGYAVSADALVSFCSSFFRASLTGEDSRVGVVVHEVSHIAAGTHDEFLVPGLRAYGPTNATTLARKASQRAANNADNYEYFIETLAE